MTSEAGLAPEGLGSEARWSLAAVSVGAPMTVTQARLNDRDTCSLETESEGT